MSKAGNELSALERALLEALLDGDHPLLEILRKQYRLATVASREFSGSGFFTHLVVPDSVPKAKTSRLVFGDVYFDLAGVKTGGGALLFVEEGRLSMLEAYLHGDEAWPETARLERLWYEKAPRDLKALFRDMDR